MEHTSTYLAGGQFVPRSAATAEGFYSGGNSGNSNNVSTTTLTFHQRLTINEYEQIKKEIDRLMDDKSDFSAYRSNIRMCGVKDDKGNMRCATYGLSFRRNPWEPPGSGSGSST
jgi:hypothetical protein